jgi:undecaprenyl-diphosphatase
MTLIQAILLGVIQGLTEFLPVSSSGHLVISQKLFGLTEPGIAFDISVHLGTLAAVVIFFWRELVEVSAAAVGGLRRVLAREARFATLFREEPNFRLAMLLAAGSVPTAIIGILLQTVSEQLFGSLSLAGGMLLVTGLILVGTGVLLWLTRGAEERRKRMSGFTLGIALAIGTVQGLAIIPGISRSGSTIAAGLLFGLDRRTAGTYSFLLSIPAIVGAAGLHLLLDGLDDVHLLPMLTGVVVSFVVGILSLGLLMRVVSRGRLYLFAPYCLLVGLAVLVFGL